MSFGQENEDSLFGGLEVKDDLESSSMSGFSFMQTSSHEEVEEETTSGFNFLTSTSNTIVENYDPPSSGFSFLSNTSVEMESQESDISRLDIVSTSNSIPYSTPNIMEDSVVEVQEIKLAKVASTKNVKKKKRTPKVGYGRDDDVAEEGADADPPAGAHSDRDNIQIHAAAETVSESSPNVKANTNNGGSSVDLREQSAPPVTAPPQQAGPSGTGTVPVAHAVHSGTVNEVKEVKEVRVTPQEIPPADVPAKRPSMTASSAPPPSSSSSKAGKGGGFMSLFGFGKSHEEPADPPPPPLPAATVPKASATAGPAPAAAASVKQPQGPQGPPAAASTVSTSNAQAPTNHQAPTDHYVASARLNTAASSSYAPWGREDHDRVPQVHVPTRTDEPIPFSRPVEGGPSSGGAEAVAPLSAPSTQTQVKGKVSSSSSAAVSTPSSAPSVKNSTTTAPLELPSVSVNQVQTKNLAAKTAVTTAVKPPEVVRDTCMEIRLLAEDEINRFKNELDLLSRRKEDLRSQGSQMELEKEQLIRDFHHLTKHIGELEVEQLRLAENEDFESADAISTQLEKSKEMLGESHTRQKMLETQKLQIDQSMFSLRNQQNDLLDMTISKLSDFKVQEESAIMGYVEKTSTELSNFDNRVQAEESRIALEKSHVEREESGLREEHATIENAIHTQTQEVQVNKDNIDMQLLGIDSEIRNLELQLAQRKEEQKKLRQELIISETKIEEVRKKYERQLQRIHDRSSAIASAKNECLKEEVSIQKDRDLYIAEQNKVMTIKTNALEWLLHLKHDIDITVKVQGTLKALYSSAGDEAQNDSSNLMVLKSHVINAEDVLSATSQTLRSNREKLNALQLEDAEILEKIPQIEAEKKGHAAAKRFKEAASVANVIKTLTSRKEEIVDLMRALETDITAGALKEVEESAKLESALSAYNNAEKDVDIVKFSEFLAKIKMLRKTRASLLKNQQDEGNLAQTSLSLLDSSLQELVNAATIIKIKHKLQDGVEPGQDELSDDEASSVDAEEMLDDGQVAGEEEATAGIQYLSGAVDGEEQEQEQGSQAGDGADDNGPVVDGVDESEEKEQGEDELVMEVDTLDAETALRDRRIVKLRSVETNSKELSNLEELLERAVDEEDYDLAADLSEKVDTLKEEVAQVLLELNCSKEEALLECKRLE